MNENYVVHTLHNGVRFIGLQMPGMESVALGIWIGIGGRFEPSHLQGISHFVEHMLFKGTTTRNAKEISEEIEGVGGHINAFTSEEFTCYMVKLRGKHIFRGLEVLTDMLNNSLFDAEEMEKEKMVVLEELHMILDNPSHYIHEIIQSLLWQGHPLGRMLVGNVDSIKRLTRKDILDYVNRYYTSRNIVISVAGNVNPEKIIESVEGQIRLSSKKAPKLNPFVSQKKPLKYCVGNKELEQIHVCIGFHAVHRLHRDRYKVKLLSVLLGENMSSRLFQKIREEHGLAYSINTSTMYFMDTGGFIISAGIKKDALKKFMRLLFKELEKVRKKKISKKELEHIKEYTIGSVLLGFEKPVSRMLFMGEYMLTMGKVPTTEEILQEIEKVSAEDIQIIANKIFNRRHTYIACLGSTDESTIKEYV